MGRLTESMQSLREAIKKQENQLKKFVKSGGLPEIAVSPNRTFNEVQKDLYELSDEQFHSHLENQLHSTRSDTSNVSHWSFSLDTINSSIGDLKTVLKKQDCQLIRLISESEELKTELKKKEKELKKQKFLLKAERVTFEQYKRDTFNEVKKNRSDENQDKTEPEKTTSEISKLRSELSHFKQLYLEQHHTVNRLTKLASSLKQDKIQLKDKLFQQEKRYNKFILEMAQRFEISRKEFNITTSKKFASIPIAPTNLAICKIADRNARLAHDNCMLRIEVTTLKQKIFERKPKGSKIQTTKSEFYDTNINDELNILLSNKNGNYNSSSIFKSSTLDRTVKTSSKNSLKCEVNTSVTSLIERNFEKCSKWQENVVDQAKSKLWSSGSKCSEETEVMRTESAPQLSVIRN